MFRSLKSHVEFNIKYISKTFVSTCFTFYLHRRACFCLWTRRVRFWDWSPRQCKPMSIVGLTIEREDLLIAHFWEALQKRENTDLVTFEGSTIFPSFFIFLSIFESQDRGRKVDNVDRLQHAFLLYLALIFTSSI